MAQIPEVCGVTAVNRPAELRTRLLALSVDLLLVLALLLVPFTFGHSIPAFRRYWLLIPLAAYLGFFALSRYAMRRTPGEFLWGLGSRPGEKRLEIVPFQLDKPGVLRASVGIFLTLSLAVLDYLWSDSAFFSHPLWTQAGHRRLDPYLPPLGRDAEWGVSAFYYTMGAWPLRFRGQTVFHAFPYQKGPPEQFAGHMVARWEVPGIRLTIEGPKSPPNQPPRAEIERCLTSLFAIACQPMRRAVLLRHVREMQSDQQLWNDWKMAWFTVINPSIPEREQAQGVYLSASGAGRGQDRYILITPQGTHQAFILDYPKSESGTLARETLESAIRTLRVTDDLNPGRAWVDKRLEDTRLADFEKIREPEEFLRRMAETQAILLSKISVEPSSFAAYYHLGGLAITLARYAARHPQENKTADWSAIARPLVQTAYRYAMDLAPSDPRTIQLQNFVLEAKKY